VFRKKRSVEKQLSVQICNKKKRRRWDGYSSSSSASSLRLTIHSLGLSFVSRIRRATLHLIAVSWLWNLMHTCRNWIFAVVFCLSSRGDGDVMRERERSSLLFQT
jgi:hypothetical protein